MAGATIHIIDDDASFLRAVARLLDACGFTTQTYHSAEEFLSQGTQAAPCCVVTDLNMSGMNGLELQRALALKGYTPPIIFLTGNGDVPSAVSAMKGGAVDFLEKRAPKELLLEAVRSALAQDERAQLEAAKRMEVRLRFSSLTERELQILEHVVMGKMNKEIAADLGIHERTVKLHRTAITTKLRVQSVAELTRLWMEAGGEGGAPRPQD